MDEIRKLQHLLSLADALTKKVIRKCEARQMHSVETLRECKQFQDALFRYGQDALSTAKPVPALASKRSQNNGR